MKSHIWKPFFHMLHQAKLPYFHILLYTLLSLLGSQLYLLFPSYTQQIMAGNINKLIILTVIAVVMGQAILTSINQFVLSVASAKITLRLRELLWNRIVRLPVPFFELRHSGELISRVTEDTAKLSDLAATFPGNMLSSVYGFAGAFIILFSYHWKLAALEAVMIPLIYLIGVWQGRIQFSYNRKIQEKTACLTGNLSEILLNVPFVKSFCNEEREAKRGEHWIYRLFQVNFARTIVVNLLLLLKNISLVIHTVAMILLGLQMISKNEITIDIWIAFYMYSQGLLNSFSSIMSIWGNVKASQGAVRRITELILEPVEENNEKTFDTITGDIVFDDVSFSYGRHPVLHHMTFTVPEGKATAIIGPSGSGKTTIFQLLERFYNPAQGTIQIGGRDISRFSLDNWRRSIGYASQSPYLFSGTIRENILYGIHREVTEEELMFAMNQAHCDEFITAMPDGLETQIGENGGKLSGGQRQRLSIARLFLQNPQILLLDEVTASLDTESDHLVEQALSRLKSGRTAIIIAHKMSSIKDADQIIVLKDGMIEQTGNHNSLKKDNSLYRQYLLLQKSNTEERSTL